MGTLTDRLHKTTCFRGLSTGYLEALAGCATLTSWQPDHYLFQQGGTADTFYLIDAGQVALEVFTSGCLRMRIQTLHAGELLGWSWLYPPYLWHFDALALTEVQAFRFDALAVRSLCENDHEFGYQLQTRITPMIIARLQTTRMQMVELYGGRAAKLG
ncbi:MAG: cyclic nucleotide-binding domain-containing protein [Candidatus Sericytochromatia bacterium]